MVRIRRDKLEESEIFGIDTDTYQTYEDLANLDEILRKRRDELLRLTTKDVKKFGIPRQRGGMLDLELN